MPKAEKRCGQVHTKSKDDGFLGHYFILNFNFTASSKVYLEWLEVDDPIGQLHQLKDHRIIILKFIQINRSSNIAKW